MQKQDHRQTDRDITPINEKIPSKDVRLIDSDGTQLGVIPKVTAIDIAKRRGLDVVLISQANPPVCKLLEYNKYRYEQQKKQKEKNKSARESRQEIKELTFRPVTGENDLNIKIKKAHQFLEDGNKVKFTMRFRGREMSHMDIAKSIFDSIAEKLSEIGTTDGKPSISGRQMTMSMSPKK
ncbi:MAG: translation initiation factor IF-3 [Candidimonas sp.]